MVVRPDLIVICHEPEGDWVSRAPEMIVEVVSTNSARRDESIKFGLYEAEGVAYYLLVYPDAKKVKAYRLVDGSHRKLGDYSDERPVFECRNADSSWMSRGSGGGKDSRPVVVQRKKQISPDFCTLRFKAVTRFGRSQRA